MQTWAVTRGSLPCNLQCNAIALQVARKIASCGLTLSSFFVFFRGKQIVGYTKKDITAQSSYCMMHYDDIPILKKMHEDCKCSALIKRERKSSQVFSLRTLVPRLTANLRWLVVACDYNLSFFFKFQVERNLRRLASCLNAKHKSMKVFAIKIRHGGLG